MHLSTTGLQLKGCAFVQPFLLSEHLFLHPRATNFPGCICL
jgi:hypothetical protein